MKKNLKTKVKGKTILTSDPVVIEDEFIMDFTPSPKYRSRANVERDRLIQLLEDEDNYVDKDYKIAA